METQPISVQLIEEFASFSRILRKPLPALLRSIRSAAAKNTG